MTETRPLHYRYSQEHLELNKSKLAQTETNDCVVKAIAAAAGVSYEASHAFAGDYLMRTNRAGTHLKMFLPNISREPMLMGCKSVIFNGLGEMRITNRYKVHGQVIRRKKTVKSFIQDNTKGSFVVTVAGHALAVVDGVLIDNAGEEYRMTRKVIAAVEVKSVVTNKQLRLL